MSITNPISKTDMARQYRNDHGSEMPTLKLARIMYRQNNVLFKDVEDARGALRAIEGKQGKNAGYKLTHPADHRPRNPYKLPESDETEYKPYILKHKKIAVLSDIHIPYHSVSAITAAFDFLKKEKPDCILLNGDTIDFYGLSRFIKDPKKRNFAKELTDFKGFFEKLDKYFPYAKKVFKLGNHEERYDHFLYMKASELSGVEEFELENIIKARANGIQVVKDKRIIKAGGLNIIHGHEFNSGFFSPVNIARGLYLRGKTSALQGHQHRTSEHTEKDMNEKMTTTWSTGCLCELNPPYAPINNWNHGMAVVYIDGNSFDVVNKRIFKGKVL